MFFGESTNGRSSDPLIASDKWQTETQSCGGYDSVRHVRQRRGTRRTVPKNLRIKRLTGRTSRWRARATVAGLSPAKAISAWWYRPPEQRRHYLCLSLGKVPHRVFGRDCNGTGSRVRRGRRGMVELNSATRAPPRKLASYQSETEVGRKADHRMETFCLYRCSRSRLSFLMACGSEQEQPERGLLQSLEGDYHVLLRTRHRAVFGKLQYPTTIIGVG